MLSGVTQTNKRTTKEHHGTVLKPKKGVSIVDQRTNTSQLTHQLNTYKLKLS
jgi:hypothetical protein